MKSFKSTYWIFTYWLKSCLFFIMHDIKILFGLDLFGKIPHPVDLVPNDSVYTIHYKDLAVYKCIPLKLQPP